MTTIFPHDRVTIVGVLNATPDSFSDGGRFVQGEARVDLERAVAIAKRLVDEGAHVLDVGGESTRPGAREVPVSVEIARTAPLIEALAKVVDVPLSIDTRKAEVAEAAIDAGASLVNDVSGLRFDPALARVAARGGVGLLLGHARGTPETMSRAPHYDDLWGEIEAELAGSLGRAREAGVAEARLAVDPGIGFGKRLEDNLALLSRPGRLREALGVPVCVGPSRKRFLGDLTGDPVDRRDIATHAACAVAIFAGADAVRVHDVAGAVRAAAVAAALRAAGRAAP